MATESAGRIGSMEIERRSIGDKTVAED